MRLFSTDVKYLRRNAGLFDTKLKKALVVKLR